MKSSWPEVDTAIIEGMEQKLYPGAAVIIGDRDGILYSNTYGRETFAPDSEPVMLDTIYDLASVSKVVGTATTSWLLLEDGRLSLDDPVAEFIPGFAEGGKSAVTVKDMLTHVSGLKAYENYRIADAKRTSGQSSADALIQHYASLPVSYQPREGYVYSCLNFQTMAHVNEVVLQGRQEDFLKKRVFGPMGMMDTGYLLSDEQLARTAPAYQSADGEAVRGVVHDPLARYHESASACPGNAGLFSSARDLARYCEMILNNGNYRGRQILKPETVALSTAIHTPKAVDEDRGLGWDVYEADGYITDFNKSPGNYVIGHSGYTGTLILLDQHSGVYMVLLTNRTFPADPGATDQTPSVTPVRKAVWQAVLASRAEYAG